MAKNRNYTQSARWSAMGLTAAALLGISGLALTAMPGKALAQAAASPKAGGGAGEKPAEGQDVIIFRDGKVMTGTVVSETATAVKFRGVSFGISFETDFTKDSILEVKRGAATSITGEGAVPASTPTAVSPRTSTGAAVTPDDGVQRQNVYWIDLKGEFGTDISESPIRDAVKDARNNNADVIILALDADWKEDGRGRPRMLEDSSNFDEIFRAEKMVPIFAEEIPREWAKQPKVVFWVKQALGGAALMPLITPEIYMTSTARLGGLGNLSFVFEGVGDEMVREKQRSLRLGHAEGWAIRGGHDYRLIRAMCRMEYVLSVKFEGGEPVLLERMPESPDEELLTDDGKDMNADTLTQRVAGTGNDLLTMDARLAKALRVSKGTVDTQEELLNALGLGRTANIVPGRSRQIMKSWSDGIVSTKRRVVKLIDDFRAVEVEQPPTYENRTKARGQQLRIINELRGLLRRWGEGISDRWRGENGIPTESQLNTIEEQIRLEQLRDRK